MDDNTGENLFFETIKDECKVIFDVGAQVSDYLTYPCEVHYFDPVVEGIELLKTRPNNNTKSVFNPFGLGEKEETLLYYLHGAFFSRPNLDNTTSVEYPIKRGDEYMSQNNVKNIDFLKIDVEGFELSVLKGFGDSLNKVKYIQFEYGVGLRDAGHNLSEVVNYLKNYNFDDFKIINYIDGTTSVITDFTDNWVWCNIFCTNKNYEI